MNNQAEASMDTSQFPDVYSAIQPSKTIPDLLWADVKHVAETRADSVKDRFWDEEKDCD